MADVKNYLPENLKNASDAFTQALIQAINVNDEFVLQTIQACIDQLYLSTANGKYLVQLGEEQGFTMPANSGLDIRAYRVLVPLMVSAPKQIRRTIDEMLQAFYGLDRTKPSIAASIAEPYNLVSGDNIFIETESGRIDVSILAGQVSDITNITAAELAAVLNTVQNYYVADTKIERSTNQRYLRITSRSEGANAFVRIVGGTVQNVMQFPFVRETSQETGTIWNVTKDSAYTDVTRFTWNGLGTNPLVYLVQPGDAVSIRGLIDGVTPISKLNGSYEVLDSGYDYFVFRNQSFGYASATITQTEDNTIFFTSSRKSILFDQPEYALTGETVYNTATITVPAIPPLARRFLSGSAHMHGYEGNVIEFTRGSLKVSLPVGLEQPQAENAFVISNKRMRYDFSGMPYRTYFSDEATEPTYNVITGGDDIKELPFTSPALTGIDSIYASVNGEEFVLSISPRHGLFRGWGFTIGGATAFGNITLGQINQEHVVTKVINDHTIVLRIKDVNGQYIKFSGISFGPFDVYRESVTRADQADFYLQFPSSGAATASGLVVDSVFKIDSTLGTNTDAYYGTNLRFRLLRVTAIDGAKIYFVAGFGPGLSGQVIDEGYGLRDGHFGGSLITYHFDQTSAYNIANVMAGFKVCFMAATKQVNPEYVGSYIYDPLGLETTVGVSGFIANTTQILLKGSNENIVFVDKVTDVLDGQDYPKTGSVVIDYGSDKFEGPIRYIAVIANQSGPSQIILDPAYRYKFSHSVGAKIQQISQNYPFTPGIDGSSYPVYLTGTAQARNTLFALLELLIASGIFLEANVLLPELLYDDVAIQPFA